MASTCMEPALIDGRPTNQPPRVPSWEAAKSLIPMVIQLSIELDSRAATCHTSQDCNIRSQQPALSFDYLVGAGED
jgi:hypothetical protein